MHLRHRYFSLTGMTVALLGFAIACVAADAPKLQGIYSNMEPSVEQGELIGMEVFILPHVRDDEVAYVALVQFSDGLPTRPQLVDLAIRDDGMSFTAVHPTEGEIGFEGTIDADGLTGRFDALGEVSLPRGESIWQWGASGR
ncbi:hypothetical protein [Thiocapsa marina]|uniref:Lipoprotein n=1 Tax=Thiocapsa marina 5811 TaxID=768671 RepID=F9UB27_9GAMM|nr:hypothetical protein [Thiocapsa marina]EGV18645.1 hypothetical protein ThimaDRAFT_2063 [Thiocapsa marina 5811]